MERTSRDIDVVRLMGLPALGPRRLRALLNRHDPSTVVAAIESGRGLGGPCVASTLLSDFGSAWRSALCESRRSFDDEALVRSLGDDRVLMSDDPEFPEVLASDPDGPAVLFARGDLAVLRARRVAMVGTRHCTEYGRATAVELAARLTERGVAIVSGLARGIDAAAHRGVLTALDGRSDGDLARPIDRTHDPMYGRPLGVVASGLDVVYPREHGGLWKLVAERGLLVGESPPGAPPERHRFPLRNRIIAALAEVVVVVESRASGGSMITVNEALQRGVPVMAVPGATSTRASDGTNLLLRDGAGIVLSADDVLDALGLDHARRDVSIDPRSVPVGFDAVVLSTLGRDGTTLGDLAGRVLRAVSDGVAFDHGIDRMIARGDVLADTAISLGRLEAGGWVVEHGGWFERRGVR